MTLCCWVCSSLQMKTEAAHPARQSHPEEPSPEAKAVTGLPAWHVSLQLTQHVHVGASCQGPHRVTVLCDEYRYSFPVCVYVNLINEPVLVWWNSDPVVVYLLHSILLPATLLVWSVKLLHPITVHCCWQFISGCYCGKGQPVKCARRMSDLLDQKFLNCVIARGKCHCWTNMVSGTNQFLLLLVIQPV
jgi:hypothetical protein